MFPTPQLQKLRSVKRFLQPKLKKLWSIEIDDHRVKCRHCRCWSTVTTFHIHDCSRSRSDEEIFHVPHKFYQDVKAIADQDPSEIAAICGL